MDDEELSFDSDFNSITSEDKRPAEETLLESAQQPRYEYDQASLDRFVGYIRKMLILFDLQDDDWNDGCTEVVEHWLEELSERLLLVYFVGNQLTASLTFPVKPVADMNYFLRNLNHSFSVDNFHEEVTFGTLSTDLEGALLRILNDVAMPHLMDQQWSESVKTTFFGAMHSFLGTLTRTHYKLSGLTILYVPREVVDPSVPRRNNLLVKRLESVVAQWSAQIRMCLDDKEQMMPQEILCLMDEYDFWTYKNEVLQALLMQLKSTKIQEILAYINRAMSQYVPLLNKLIDECAATKQLAEQKIHALGLMVEPCRLLETTELASIPFNLIRIIQIIRYLSIHTIFSKSEREVTRLFAFLSNQLIVICASRLNIDELLRNPDSRASIQLCNVMIDCCVSYKIIVVEMERDFNAKDPAHLWRLNHDAMFHQIDGFLNRLYDVIDILEATIVYGRHDESNERPKIIFGCNNGSVYESLYAEMQKRFATNLDIIQGVTHKILNIHDDSWFDYICKFHEVNDELEKMAQFIIENSLTCTNNIEEVLEVLTTLIHFTNKESLQVIYEKKVLEVLEMFALEITKTEFDVKKENLKYYPPFMPKNAGKALIVIARSNRLQRLKKLVQFFEYIPSLGLSEVTLDAITKFEELVKTNLKALFEDFVNDSIGNIQTRISRSLMAKSIEYTGFVDCNIDRKILQQHAEIEYFESIKMVIPVQISTVYKKNKNLKFVYNNVLSLILDFNKIRQSLSEKERLLFGALLKGIDKRVTPGFTKLMWDTEVTESYIQECNKKIEEIDAFIAVYKIVNTHMAKLCEDIGYQLLMTVKIYQPTDLSNLRYIIMKDREDNVRKISKLFKDIVNSILIVYEGFEHHIATMTELWIDYVRKIDLLVEKALITSTVRSLEKILDMISFSEFGSQPNVILQISLDLQESDLIYDPESDQIVTVLYKALTDSSIMKLVPRLTEKFGISAAENQKGSFFQCIINDRRCVELKNSIKTVLLRCHKNLTEYTYTWMEFSSLWLTDMVEFIAHLLLQDPDAKEFNRLIQKYKAVVKQVRSQEASIKIDFINVGTQALKETLKDYAKKWIRSISRTCTEISVRKLEEFYECLAKNIKDLEPTPVTLEDLQKTIQLHKQFLGEIESKEQEIQHIQELFDLMETSEIDVPTKVKIQEQDLPDAWEAYKANLAVVEGRLGESKERFKLYFLAESKKLNKEAEEMLNNLPKMLPVAEDISPAEALSQIRELKEKLKAMFEAERQIQENLRTFNINKPDNQDLKIIEERLNKLEEVWLSVQSWQEFWEHYATALFTVINIDELEATSLEIFGKINFFAQFYHDQGWPFLQVAREKVFNFKQTLPLITYLKNPAMQTRHWNKVREVTGKGFDETSPNFNLATIIGMNLQNYGDFINEISNAATMEMQIEKGIQNIEEVWRTLKIGLSQYKDVYWKIQSVDDCIQRLEDDLVAISAMKSTKFVEPFEESVTYWERTLSYVYETIELTMQVQRKWLYFEEIFQGDDIRRDMKTEADLFQELCEEWQLITENLKQSPVIVEGFLYVPPPQLFTALTVMLEKLETIQKALEIYLEQKRYIFPRFYFISNDDLLEILGNSKHPNAIQVHMKKLFDNLSRLKLGRCQMPSRFNQWEASGMLSDDGEFVPFAKTIFLEGAVEHWFGLVESTMRKTLHELLEKTYQSLRKMHQRRDKWMEMWPGQLCLISTQLKWTADCTKCLELVKVLKEKAPLKKLKKRQNKMLSKLSELTRQELSEQMRLKLNSMITIEIHSRDVIEKLYKRNVRDVNQFEWSSQLRYYWDHIKNDCAINQTNTQFWYGYEYTGNSGRLVITPLTDRAYMTLTISMHLHRGGSPQGPAGTGKTETVKDLGKALGVWVIVNNCSEGLDYKSMAKFFSGLAQSGSWGCFDEFNRINIEVLSVVAQQIYAILSGLTQKLTKIMFEGDTINLKSTVAIFITMNPGYAGRTELPDNLKSMFRPISMMVPDDIIIAENLLYSDGFATSKVLAKKVCTLYGLSKLQLSKQFHYDFGLRSMVSLLRYAGVKRRLLSHLTEDQVMYTAIKDMNYVKLTFDDLPLFDAIVMDILPGISIPEIQYEDLEAAIRRQLKVLQLQPITNIITKIIQLYEMKLSRHSVIVLGETCTAKSVTWKVLQAAYNDLKSKGNPKFVNCEVFPLNPKSMTLGELYGEYNFATGEWKDGVLSYIMRTICAKETPDQKWLLFDGPIDAIWIENMNSVMDDNKILTLVNGERITMPKQVSLLFENHDLSTASPATVSRCGMVYNDFKEFGWQPFVTSWLDKKATNLSVVLQPLIKNWFQIIIDLKNKVCREIVKTQDLNLIEAFCKLWDCVAQPQFVKKEPNGQLVTMYFLFCVVWSMGATTDVDGRQSIDVFVKEKTGIFPLKGTVYDYFVDDTKVAFIGWESLLPTDWELPKETPFYKLIVPTVDTVRYNYILEKLLLHQCPVMLIGDVGTGKTSLALNLLSTIKGDTYSTFSINMTAQTTAGFIQETLENCTEKRSKNLFVPKNNKQLVCFIDDFNMPTKEEYGAQPPLELLRQWMDYEFWYDLDKLSRKYFKFITLIAGMGPPGGSRETISTRTLSRFNIINFTFPSQDILFGIFHGMLASHLRPFDTGVQEYAKPITSATLQLYDAIVKKMLPTPAKIHYMFNLRDISKVFQGLLRGHEMFSNSKAQYLRLWVHECFRVLSDRLIDESDSQWFLETLNSIMGQNFDVTLHSLCPNSESPIFCNLMNIHRHYEDMVKNDELINFIKTQLDEYNKVPGTVRMNLIMFKEAVLHLMRIVRVITQPKGHMLVVGMGGSGRQSLCRLAAFLCEQITYQIEVTNKYHMAEFKEDLKVVYQLCGVKNKQLCFLLSDSQMVEDTFLEVVNNMLGNGQVFNLFKPDELDDIRNKLREKKVQQPIGSNDEVYNFLGDKFIENVHILFCVSPIGPNLSKYVRNFPGLINFTTIDWYKQWPEVALNEVAVKYLANIQLNAPLSGEVPSEKMKEHQAEEDRRQTNTAKMCSTMHLNVIAGCLDMELQFKRHNYVAPTNFLELLNNYQENLHKKRGEKQTALQKFQNGLLKINETEAKVAVMSEELKVNQEQVTAFQAECDAFIKIIQLQTAEADVAKEQVSEQSKKIAVEEDKCKVMAEQAQGDLDAAMPALRAAIAALDSLNKKDLTEIRSFPSPPVKVERVLEAVMILLLKEPSWAEAKRQLGDQKFLDRLRNFDKNHMSDKVLKKISIYTQDRELEPEKVGVVSIAAKSLILWVRAIEKYGKVWKIVGPKQQAVEDAEEQLKEKQEQLAMAKAKLEALAEKLEQLQKDFDEKTRISEELKAKAEKLRLMLERAVLLVDGLSSERLRWVEVIKELQKDFLALPGDTLLSTAFICYMGPFVSQFRDALIKTWSKQIAKLEIPRTEHFVVTDFLCDTFTKLEWNVMGLPSDAFSMENAVCTTNCTRWPLLIDPQSQSHKWIQKMEEPNGILTLDVGQIDFVEVLEKAMHNGRPVLVLNLLETVDAVLTPIVNKAFVHQAGQVLLKFNNKFISYDLNFKLYLTTKMANPHYLPEVTTKTCLINFSIKEEGLEDQLLGIIVVKERPSMEEQKNSLTTNISNHKKTILKLENDTLRLLNESKGPILENEMLISTLQSAKETTVTVKEALATAEVTEREINFVREGYRSGAKRAAILYFVIQDLANIDPMYQFSLAAYNDIFRLSIEKSTKNPVLDQRIENLNEYHTFSLYKFICRGLFEKHKLLFSFFMCVKILMAEGNLKSTEYNFLLKGGVVLDRDEQAENPSPDWISEMAWDNITELDKLSGYHGIADSFAESSEEWKEWFSSSEPEITPLIGEYRNFSQFSQMLIIRSLRADRMSFCLTAFVEHELGRRFVEPPTLNLKSIFDESIAKTPLIFLLSPGMDPVGGLWKLAETTKMSSRLDVVSLGQGQAEVATRLIHEGAQNGRWVFLANCHLSISWMHKLDRIIDTVQGQKIHKKFRLWLSSDPHPSFPVSILQKSVKMTTEPPKGIRANMSRMYTVLTEDNFKKCRDKVSYPKLSFCLCFFHSILIERKKFKQLGWNSVYSFNDSDFEISENIISIYLNEFEEMPWDALRYMISSINYGGHVTDAFDQRLLTSYSDQCFSENAVNVEHYKLATVANYYIPKEGTYQSYQDFVKLLPNFDEPSVFGQHQNAEINSLLVESKVIFDTLLSLQSSQAAAKATERKEEKVDALAADLLDKMPALVDYGQLKKMIGTNKTPLNIILMQEVQRYNLLLVRIMGDLKTLRQAIAGFILLTADLGVVFQSILDGRVPTSWQTVYPSLKPLGSWFRDLRARISFFTKWVETLRPPVFFWLAGFSFPSGFLTAVLQTTARSMQVPIDTLGWNFIVFDAMKPTVDSPDEGVFVERLNLEGASWCLKAGTLCEPKLMELISPMPPVHFLPVVVGKRRTRDIYECPAYYYSVRVGTPKYGSYVLTVDLKRGQHTADFWVKRGAALLLNLTD